jgi:hypothetical protein
MQEIPTTKLGISTTFFANDLHQTMLLESLHLYVLDTFVALQVAIPKSSEPYQLEPKPIRVANVSHIHLGYRNESLVSKY